MFGFLRALFSKGFPKKETDDPDALKEERWTARFAAARRDPPAARFRDADAPAYAAKVGKDGLELVLKKGDCVAWAEDPLYRYSDFVAEADFAFVGKEAYSAAGLLFRQSDDTSYYSVLVSTKGYFRVDAVFNGTPMPLVGWTETPRPVSRGEPVRLRVIARGDRITVTLDDAWAAEVADGTLAAGRLAFAAAAYGGEGGTAALLRRFRIDSRPVEVEAVHLRWNALIRVDSAARLRLAATFAAMGQPLSALVQLKRAWKASSAAGDATKPDPEGSSAADAAAGAGSSRSQAELLLAADCALRLSLLREAEDFLDACLEADPESAEGRKAVAEKAKLLYAGGRYAELRDHAEEAVSLFPDDPVAATLLGHAYANLGAPAKAADAYDAASRLDPANGLILQAAASAREEAGDADGAFDRFLRAGRAFLEAQDYDDLALIPPRLFALKPRDPAAHALAGKHAFAAEDSSRAAKELALAEAGGPSDDPAVPFLRGLLLVREGKRAAAVPFLERAAAAEPGYGPFRFRLAEARYLAGADPRDPRLAADLEAALAAAPEDGWTANLAAQVAAARGDLEAAEAHAEAAAAALGAEPAVAANRAEIRFRRGDADGAFAALDAAGEDAAGILANQRGNLLVRLGRYEEAEAAYARALKANPSDADYLRNRASCLIELGRFGEADDDLSKAFDVEPSPRTLELTAYVAAKKGELPRAEAACRVGLELDPDDAALLSSLAWTYLSLGRWQGVGEAADKMEKIAKERGSRELAADAAELRARVLDATTRTVRCAGCGRTWRVPKDAPPAPALRLVAEPPDDLPAGTCPSCLSTWCIGCGKASLSGGRFACPRCGERLKLLDEGLKKLLADWAASASPADSAD